MSFLRIRNLSGPTSNSAARENHRTDAEDRLAPGKLWHDLNLDIRPGDVIMIRGASGTGKSTMLKQIANLTPYNQGHESTYIELESSPILVHDKQSQSRTLHPSIYRSRIGYVPQRPALFPGSPLDLYDLLKRLRVYKNRQLPNLQNHGDMESNVSVCSEQVNQDLESDLGEGPGWRMDMAKDLVQSSGNEEPIFESNAAVVNLPVGNLQSLALCWGVETSKLATSWSELSGGEAQRVALALSVHMRFLDQERIESDVYSRGSVSLLLDEPTSALDDDIAKEVETSLVCGEALQDTAILWITHSASQAKRIENMIASLNRRNLERKRRFRTLRLGV